MRRVLTNPLLALVLGVALLIDVWYWGTQSSHRHVALLAAPCCIVQLGRSVTPAIPLTFVVDEEGLPRLVDPDSAEGWAITTAPVWPDSVRGHATAFPMERSYGLLARVVSSRSHTLHVYSDTRPFDAAEMATIRTQFAEFLRTYRGGSLAGTGYLEAFAKGDGTLTEFHLPAAVHDLLAACALAVTITGGRRFLRERREDRRRRAIEQPPRCPMCRYDVSGIADRCPECGSSLGPEGGSGQGLTPPTPPPSSSRPPP